MIEPYRPFYMAKEVIIMRLDNEGLKDYINEIGIRQTVVAERSGIPKSKLCFILQGKRRCEAGEYASICNALCVPMSRFLKPGRPEDKPAG